VATCEHCPGIAFPMSAPSRFDLVRHGYQTAAGFTIAGDRPVTVGSVAGGSPAAQAGLLPGDRIVEIRDFRKSGDNLPIEKYFDDDPEDLTSFRNCLVPNWPHGKTDLALTVDRNGEVIDLPSFTPWKPGFSFTPQSSVSLHLHPTQIYESISMLLMFLLLTAYYPLRRRDGEVMIIFMIGYAVHRFLNEMLRNDTDPVLRLNVWGMALEPTLSQCGSILFLIVALILAWMLWRKPVQYRRAIA
jgi:hypothetical protein